MLTKTLMATIVAAALASASALAQSERSPTDGRSGGTGVPSAVSGATPSTSTSMDAQSDRHASPSGWESWATPYSLTDGDSGGAGVPSAVSGAAPSTSPAEDLERLKSGNHATVTNALPERHSWFNRNRSVQ
jgi:hypothetical protein